MGIFSKEKRSNKIGDAPNASRAGPAKDHIFPPLGSFNFKAERRRPIISPRPSVTPSVLSSFTDASADHGFSFRPSDGTDEDDAKSTKSDSTISLHSEKTVGLDEGNPLEALLSTLMGLRKLPLPSNTSPMSSVLSGERSGHMSFLSSIDGEMRSKIEQIQRSRDNQDGPTKKPGRYTKQEKWSVLHMSAQEGKLAQVKALLARGCDVEIEEDNLWTPIMMAAQNGHLQVVREFIAHGANVNHKGDDGVTALRQASQNGHLEVVEFLLSHGADPNIATFDRGGPLHIAVTRLVIPNTGVDRQTYSRIVRALISAGANVNITDEDGDTPLHLVCMSGDLTTVKLIVASKANIGAQNKDGRTPLSHAAYNAKTDIVRYLLENGASPHAGDRAKRWTPLHFASQFVTPTTLDTIKVLIRHGADVNSRTETNATALCIAAQEGDVDIIQFLIDSGAHIDACTSSGRTPLFQATANSHCDAVKVLANAGADVNVMETKAMKIRPLHLAIVKKDVKMVQTLLALKADANMPTGMRNTSPLSLAAMLDGDADEIFMMLLDHGAHPA